MDRYLIDMEVVENLSRAFDTGRPGLVRKIIGEMRLARIVTDEDVRRMSSSTTLTLGKEATGDSAMDIKPMVISNDYCPIKFSDSIAKHLSCIMDGEPGTEVELLAADPVNRRADESVSIFVRAKWTGPNGHKFYGSTYDECIQVASEARQSIERAESAMTPTPPEKISEMFYGTNPASEQ